MSDSFEVALLCADDAKNTPFAAEQLAPDCKEAVTTSG